MDELSFQEEGGVPVVVEYMEERPPLGKENRVVVWDAAIVADVVYFCFLSVERGDVHECQKGQSKKQPQQPQTFLLPFLLFFLFRLFRFLFLLLVGEKRVVWETHLGLDQPQQP